MGDIEDIRSELAELRRLVHRAIGAAMAVSVGASGVTACSGHQVKARDMDAACSVVPAFCRMIEDPEAARSCEIIVSEACGLAVGQLYPAEGSQ